jgi:hypothetical protein
MSQLDEEDKVNNYEGQSNEDSQYGTGHNVTMTRMHLKPLTNLWKEIDTNNSVVDANHIGTVVVTPREDHGDLEYLPLILQKLPDVPEDSDAPGVEFKIHVGDPHSQTAEEQSFADLPSDCLIRRQQENGVKVAVCITMYNEPYKQVLESLAGVYRSYYELVQIDGEYEGRMTIVIV